jgi:hypothetical protein
MGGGGSEERLMECGQMWNAYIAPHSHTTGNHHSTLTRLLVYLVIVIYNNTTNVELITVTLAAAFISFAWQFAMHFCTDYDMYCRQARL